MKKLLISALAVFAAGAALADDPTIDNSAATPSLKTRGQVVAEFSRAQADGSIKAWANRPQLNSAQDIRSVKTRDEVKADVIAARHSGELNVAIGEDSGSLARATQRRGAVAPTVLAGSAR